MTMLQYVKGNRVTESLFLVRFSLWCESFGFLSSYDTLGIHSFCPSKFLFIFNRLALQVDLSEIDLLVL